MEKADTTDPAGRFLERVAQGIDDVPDYATHPSPEILRAYARRALPNDDQPSLDRLYALNRGERSDWRQTEVGLHVKTCPSCAPALHRLRQAVYGPAGASEPTLWQRFLSVLTLPKARVPRLAWAASYLIILGLGVAFGFLLQPGSGPMELGELDPTQAVEMIRGSTDTTDPATALMIAQVLQQAGVDLRRYDFEQRFEYAPDAGESLADIAQSQYGSTRAWVVIYLLNRDYAPLQQALAGRNNPAEVPLPEGLALVLVDRQ